MLLAMVFDIAEKLSEFIENKATVYDIVLKYYVNFFLFYGNTFSSLIVFISVIWFTAKMAQDSEIIPMLFSGRPFKRILRPYFIAATILLVLSLILNHFILPRSNRVRLDFEEHYYRDQLYVENYQAEFPGNELMYYSTYSSTENVVNDMVLEHYDSKNRLVYFMKARTAVYNDSTKMWKLTDVVERFVEHIDSIPQNSDKPNQLERLKEVKEKTVKLQFSTKDIALRDNAVSAMTYSKLAEFIEKERKKGNPNLPTYEIELYQRTSYPFATYVLTLIGVSVSSRKKRGGVGINIAIGLMFVFMYIFSMKITTVAATNVGFPPIIAVWIPNILFGILALFLYRIAPK